MRNVHRLAAMAGMAALTLSLTACGAAQVSGQASGQQSYDIVQQSFAGAGPVAADGSKKDGKGLNAVGLTADGNLVRFDTDDPDRTKKIGQLKGLDSDTALIGIDYRVQDGKLYGVGDKGGVYTIDDGKGTVTKVRQLTVALEGTSFGVDFNPAANALRITSDTGQNLRQPFATPDAPTAADTPLTNPAVPPATGTTPATGVTAAGYTNNDLDMSTATTLFDLDTALDRVSVQSPANAGSLAPAGNLPGDIKAEAGFDIYSTLDKKGRTVANDAFATVTTGGDRKLWAVDLLTGSATDLGKFDAKVIDLAIELKQ